MTLRAVLLLPLLLAPAMSLADVCRWTDASGQTHYASSPPPGVTCAKTLRVQPAQPRPSSGNGAKSTRDLEVEFQKRRGDRLEAEQRAAEEKAKAEQRAELCGQARGRLTWLEGGGRVARINAQGERQILGDEEILQEIAAARRRVTQHCSP
jgi:hypothetical protein